MRLFLLVCLFISSFSISPVLGQSIDLGIEKLLYPEKPFSIYELNSRIPTYYKIKNFGDSIDNRVIELVIYAQGSSPSAVEFRTSMLKNQEGVLDGRKDEFFTSGLANIPNIGSVMSFVTPELNAGDTMDVCVEIYVKGDIDPTNNVICFKVILEEQKLRDLALHILNPKRGDKVELGQTITFDLSIRNDGQESYTQDSIFSQLAIEKGSDLLSFVSVKTNLDVEIKPGDSALVKLDVPITDENYVGDLAFGFRLQWVSPDRAIAYPELNDQNNIRYVLIKSSLPSSIGSHQAKPWTIHSSSQKLIISQPKLNHVSNVNIYDLSGKKVAASQIVQAGTAQSELSTYGLNNGYYIITIDSENTLLHRQKVYLSH